MAPSPHAPSVSSVSETQSSPAAFHSTFGGGHVDTTSIRIFLEMSPLDTPGVQVVERPLTQLWIPQPDSWVSTSPLPS